MVCSSSSMAPSVARLTTSSSPSARPGTPSSSSSSALLRPEPVHLAYPMVLVQITMFNEKELSIGASCGLFWPPDRIIIQVFDDSTDPIIKVSNVDLIVTVVDAESLHKIININLVKKQLEHVDLVLLNNSGTFLQCGGITVCPWTANTAHFVVISCSSCDWCQISSHSI